MDDLLQKKSCDEMSRIESESVSLGVRPNGGHGPRKGHYATVLPYVRRP